MKACLLIFSALMLLTYAAPASALGPLDAEAELGLFSKYVWRGMVATDGPVMQPEASVSLLGFELGFWANMDLDDSNGSLLDPDGFKGEFNEVNYILGYEFELPLLELEAGFIHYDFPNTDVPATTEFYAGAEAHVLLSPSLTIYYDFDEIDGAYLQAGIGHAVPLSPAADLQFTANLGYGTSDYVGGYFGYVPAAKALGDLPSFGSGPTDFLLGAELPYHPIPLATLSVGAYYSTLLGDAKDAAAATDCAEDAFFVGVKAGLEF